MIKTVQQLRDQFWLDHPEFKECSGRTQNNYSTDIRVTWVEYIDYMQRDGQISEQLANVATL